MDEDDAPGVPDDDRDHRPLPRVELPSINRAPVSDRSNAGYRAHTPGIADGGVAEAPPADPAAPADPTEPAAAEESAAPTAADASSDGPTDGPTADADDTVTARTDVSNADTVAARTDTSTTDPADASTTDAAVERDAAVDATGDGSEDPVAIEEPTPAPAPDRSSEAASSAAPIARRRRVWPVVLIVLAALGGAAAWAVSSGLFG